MCSTCSRTRCTSSSPDPRNGGRHASSVATCSESESRPSRRSSTLHAPASTSLDAPLLVLTSKRCPALVELRLPLGRPPRALLVCLPLPARLELLHPLVRLTHLLVQGTLRERGDATLCQPWKPLAQLRPQLQIVEQPPLFVDPPLRRTPAEHAPSVVPQCRSWKMERRSDGRDGCDGAAIMSRRNPWRLVRSAT